MGNENPSNNSGMNEISKGMFTAIFERAILGQPLYRMKVDFQSTGKIKFNPFWLYSGFFAFSFNMSLQISAQFYFNFIAKQLMDKQFGENNNNYKFAKDFTQSALAGSLSTLISSPIESVIIYQSANESKFNEAYKTLYKNGLKNFYRGVFAASCREAIFTPGYLVMTPYFQNYLKSKYNINDNFAWCLSVFCVGTLSTIASQPFDVINTEQKSAKCNQSMSFYKAATSMPKKNLFKGTLLRITGVMWATGMYNLAPTVYDKISTNSIKNR